MIYMYSIEYPRDDVTKKLFFLFFAFQVFEYHIWVEHDEKPPKPKFGGNWFMVARDSAA